MVLIELRETGCSDGDTCWKPAGSGFFVSPDGLIMTAAHVLSPENRPSTGFEFRVRKIDPSEPPKLVKVRDEDADADIACLYYPASATEELATIQVGLPQQISLNTRFFVAGYPNGAFLRETAVTLLSKRLDLKHAGKWLVTPEGITNGDSGGPVVEVVSGRAVAIVSEAQPISNQVYLAPIAANRLSCAHVLAERAVSIARPAEGRAPVAGPANPNLSEQDLAAIRQASQSSAQWHDLAIQLQGQLLALQRENDVTNEQLKGFFRQLGESAVSGDQLAERLAKFANRLREAEIATRQAALITAGTDDPRTKATVQTAAASLAAGNWQGADAAIGHIIWRWPPGAPRTIPVCWEGHLGTEADRELVRRTIAESWQPITDISFTGWLNCVAGNPGVHLLIEDSSPRSYGVGRQLDGRSHGIVLNTIFQQYSTWCNKTEAQRSMCIRAFALHEFGHVLGFPHGHTRPDAPLSCQQKFGFGQPTDPRILSTPYDPNSIMNYCNPTLFSDPHLSAEDKVVASIVYGGRRT